MGGAGHTYEQLLRHLVGEGGPELLERVPPGGVIPVHETKMKVGARDHRKERPHRDTRSYLRSGVRSNNSCRRFYIFFHEDNYLPVRV